MNLPEFAYFNLTDNKKDLGTLFTTSTTINAAATYNEEINSMLNNRQKRKMPIKSAHTAKHFLHRQLKISLLIVIYVYEENFLLSI